MLATAPSRSTRAALERAVLIARELKARQPIWRPLAGPQTMAYETTADIIGFGGAAGGGKTDLACGKALTKHRKVMMLRRVGTELTGIEDRLEELLGSRDGYNGQKKIWRTKRRDGMPLQIEFASLPNLGDEKGYQGRPHDLLVFDEASNFLEAQVRFLLGWVRTTTPGQQTQALLTFNPPTSAEGRWIISFFGPWIDRKHPLYPTPPGVIRYAAMLPQPDGTSRDVWVDSARPFVLVDGVPRYEFDPADYPATEVITPKSRTFIPSRITDNPYLMGTGYMAQLQALPEPLRSQMLNGDFLAGIEEDPWQVIPTAWIELAQARWKPLDPKPEMMALGVDVARGGKDKTVLAPRHDGWWFDKLQVHPGSETPNGPAVAGLVIAAQRDHANQYIDVIGVGASPYDFLRQARQPVFGINVAEKSNAHDKSGRLTFVNQRSEYWWRMRELLDPEANNGIALPPDPELLADLAAPRWTLVGKSIQVESREDIIERIGRSPDRASAVILATIDAPKDMAQRLLDESGAHSSGRARHDPFARDRLQRRR